MKSVLAALLALGLAAVPVVAEDENDEKKGVWSTLDLQLYGTIKLDAAYDSGNANPGNFVKWVDLDLENPDDDAFSMTANQTRLGLWVRGPEEKGRVTTRGRVEIDFYGGGAENKPRPMLRHAYLELDWRESGWKFLAGQASDVISPLVPSTINYSVSWWAGNIGYRRAQLRGTRTLSLSDSSQMTIVGALSRDIGDAFSEYENRDAGADSGLPGAQMRLGWGFGESGPGRIDFGISGHWAAEEYEVSEDGVTADYTSWSLNLDYKHRLSAKARLQFELFTGEDLASYLGGVGQGINLDAGTEIRSQGGWIALDLGPWETWNWHLGISLDDPDDDDLEIGDRSRNRAIWASGDVAITRHVKMGLELSHWSTDYLGLEEADSFRTQFAVYYQF
jgi:hypothetical protein